MKRLLLLLLPLVLTGCVSTANRNNILNLLSSPRLSERESRIMASLSEYSGQEIKLKYPKKGENISPVQIVDLDGDGTDEAVVLYNNPADGTTACMALLDRTGDKWVVTETFDGWGSEVYRVDFRQLKKTEGSQIIVGYTFADDSEIILSVYFLESGRVDNVYTQTCQEYVTHDVTGDKIDDIVLAGINAPGQATQLKVFSAHNRESFDILASRPIEARNVDVTNISFSSSDYSPSEVILLDYEDRYHRVYTEAVYYSDYELIQVLHPDVVQKIWYFEYGLNSRDVNGDGWVETPTIIDDGKPFGHSLKHMEWTCFLRENPQRMYYGVCHAENGVFFPLPDEWMGNISLDADEDGRKWRVIRTADDDVLVTFRLVSPSEKEKSEGTVTVSKGTVQVKITFHRDVSLLQREYISSGLIYMK